MKIEFTSEEIAWLFSGLPINSSVMSKAVPHSKLRELFDFKEKAEQYRAALAQVVEFSGPTYKAHQIAREALNE